MKRDSILARFDPAIHDDNPPMDLAFMTGMAPSHRRGLPHAAPTVEVRLRLDMRTVDHLRRAGPGWQLRLDALLARLIAAGEI